MASTGPEDGSAPLTESPAGVVRALGALGRVERAASAVAFLTLTAVLGADVLSREISGAGLVWARQLGVYANLLLTLAGIGLASAGGAHLRPRFADGWLPARWTPVVSRLQEAVMAAACLAFAAVAAAAVHETWRLAERTAVPDWPVWSFQLVIPGVFAIAALRHGCFALWPALAPREGEEG